jgi:ribosomal protein S18 acetylase RimI-like enzyme
MGSGPKDDVLDNAVWHALRTRQAHFAEGDSSGRAIRFDREVAFFGAVEQIDAASWEAQVELAGPEGITVFFRDEVPGPPSGWEEVFRGPTWQMVAGDLRPVPDLSPVALGPDDAAEMLALAQLTEPGPFFPRTHEMGTYVGVKREGRIVAMAGERLKLPGWTEISAVCTHPEAQRQGLGAALTLWMARSIRDAGDEAFLHVLENNENALRLYQALGFEIRRKVQAVVMKRLPDDDDRQ